MRSASSQMTRPSPRLWIVVARRWRCASTRWLAVARSAPIVLNATPTASSSFGPPASTRALRSPDDSRRVAPTRSSSGRRIARISRVRKASTPTSARPAPNTIASSAVRERSRPRRGRSRARACWRVASALRRRCARCAGCAWPTLRVASIVGCDGERARRRGARGAIGAASAPAGVVAGGEPLDARRRRRRSCARRWRRSARRGASAAARGSPPAPRSRRAGWPRRPRARTASATRFS